MPQLVAKLRRDPLAIFLLAGAVIFLLYWAFQGRKEIIEVPADVQEQLLADYEMMTGAAPDDAARTKLIDDFIANEMLFRESVQRGMHMTDLTTKQRLIDRVRFMISGAPAEPTEDQLLAWYAEHPEQYLAEPSLTLQHVFFENKPDNIDALRQQIASGGAVKGDDFWMGRDLDHYGYSVIRAMFGPDFLAKAKALPVGEWAGPIQSSRGWHLVKVNGSSEERMVPYPEVRDQVRQDFTANETVAAVTAELERLKKEYTIRVE